MSVSVLNALSPVTPAKGVDGMLASTVSGEVTEPFSTSFSAQLQAQGQAQQGTTLEKIASLLRGEEGQSVSALLGDSLPYIQAQEINLDETMTALKDVLAYLDALETDTELILDDLSAALIQEHGLMSQSPADIVPDQSNEAIISANIIDLLPQTPANSEPDSEQVQVGQGLDSSIDELHEELILAINIVDQVRSSVVIDDAAKLVEQLETAIPQLVRQEKTVLADKLSVQAAKLSDESVEAGASLDHLLKREGLLNVSDNIAERVPEKMPKSPLELNSATASLMPDQAAHKFSTADLNVLSRQVENMAAKQELPAMTKPFNHPEWKQEFNERIIWMHNKSIPSAELRLNPQHLGPVSIQINVDKDQQASILFNAHNAGVRDAIEAALPKLREMLNAQQVTLAEANVSQQQQQGQGSARQAMQDVLDERNSNGENNSVLHESDSEINAIAEEINQGRAVASKGLLSLYA